VGSTPTLGRPYLCLNSLHLAFNLSSSISITDNNNSTISKKYKTVTFFAEFFKAVSRRELLSGRISLLGDNWRRSDD